MDPNETVKPPPLSDRSPWAQGFNDWLVFGDKASAFSDEMIGHEDYNRGKREGRD